jgi:serine/threonine protein kinase
MAMQIASALAAAHARGIAHRDIKPDNVMVRTDGYVKVLDFGLAKLVTGPPDETTALRTQPGLVIGTPHYMSPEQAEGKDVDERSDIFSLGVMLYELTTGTRPFTGDSTLSVLSSILRDTPRPLTDMNPSLPAGLQRIVNRALPRTVIGAIRRLTICAGISKTWSSRCGQENWASRPCPRRAPASRRPGRPSIRWQYFRSRTRLPIPKLNI